jgi:hypothetical protein
MLFRLDTGTGEGLCGTGGGFASLYGLIAAKLDDEPLSLTDEDGVEVPLVEDDDLSVGTVPLDLLEESEVRKLALERLRSSFKNGILCFCGLIDFYSLDMDMMSAARMRGRDAGMESKGPRIDGNLTREEVDSRVRDAIRLLQVRKVIVDEIDGEGERMTAVR